MNAIEGMLKRELQAIFEDKLKKVREEMVLRVSEGEAKLALIPDSSQLVKK